MSQVSPLQIMQRVIGAGHELVSWVGLKEPCAWVLTLEGAWVGAQKFGYKTTIQDECQ